MNTRKLKIIAYAVYKYLQGYTLLKNPQGTPWTSVKILQKYHYIKFDTLDMHNTYRVISADFSGSKKKEIKELLFSTKYAFFDKETNELTYRKAVQYYKMDDTHTEYANKGIVPLGVLRKRDLAHVHRPVARITDESIIRMGHLGMPIGIETVETDKTFGEYVVEHFYNKKYKSDVANLQFQEGLFKTLRHNLSR